MEDIFVQVIDMDVMIPEHVVKNQDGSYTVFLNVQEIESVAHEDVKKCDVAAPDPVVAVAENIVKQPKLRRRRRNRKKEQFAQDRLNFILENFSQNDSWNLAERQWLYGNEL